MSEAPLPPASAAAFDRLAGRWSALEDPDTGPGREAEARIALLRTLCVPAARVLEVGCGTGVNLVGIADRIALGVGIDFSPAMIRRARSLARRRGAPHLRFAVGDALALDAVHAATGPFDLVILAGVLEHLPARGRVLDVCRDRLAPDGRIVVVTPHPANPSFLWRRIVQRRPTRMFASDLHMRPAQLKRLARSRGLRAGRALPLPCLPEFDDGPPPPRRVRRAFRLIGRLPCPAARGAYALVLRRAAG